MAKKSTTPAAPRTRRVTTKPAVAPGNGNANASAQNHQPAAPAPQLSADEIAQAAYQRYLSRGGQHGSDFDDWIEAERELTRQRSR
jgi:hypothetical protein